MATLIAAGRLDESLLDGALRRLAAAGLAATAAAWIEAGAAIDLDVAGEAAAIRAAIEGWEGIDIVVHPTGHRVRASLFVADMDSTMIGQECIDELADYAGLKPQVAAITERAMQGELDFAAALAERVALLAGMERATVDRCLAERVRPNPGAETLVRTLRARGVFTQLVTGGFTAFAAPVAEALGFDAVEANILELEAGVLTGRTQGDIVDSSRKRSLLEQRLAELGLDRYQSLAIGDGANDAPMIAAAGLGVGYRPKPALAAVADAVLLHHDLDALLWAQGIPRCEWVI